MKYVLSATTKDTEWKNTKFIKSVGDIKKLRESDGPDIQVWGSSQLVHLLLENDLVDELRLMTYPLILGKGKKLFADSATPAAFKLLKSRTGTSGVIVAWYKRAGKVTTGSFADS
jgi:dihydrofolate reductase